MVTSFQPSLFYVPEHLPIVPFQPFFLRGSWFSRDLFLNPLSVLAIERRCNLNLCCHPEPLPSSPPGFARHTSQAHLLPKSSFRRKCNQRLAQLFHVTRIPLAPVHSNDHVIRIVHNSSRVHGFLLSNQASAPSLNNIIFSQECKGGIACPEMNRGPSKLQIRGEIGNSFRRSVHPLDELGG